MSEIIESWRQAVYLQPIAQLLLIIAFIVSLIKRKYLGELRLTPFYLGAFIFLSLCKYVLSSIDIQIEDPRMLSFIATFPDFAINLIEFITFLYYLYHATSALVRKEIIHFTGLVGIVSYLFGYFYIIAVKSPVSIFRINNFFIIVSAILLLITIVHYTDFSRQHRDGYWDPTKSPNFWASAGLLFYLGGTFTFKIIANYFYVNTPVLYQSLYAIMWLYYSLLFLLLIQAYRYAKATKLSFTQPSL